MSTYNLKYNSTSSNRQVPSTATTNHQIGIGSTISNTHSNRYDKHHGSVNGITITTSTSIRPRPLPPQPTTSKNTTFDVNGATTRLITNKYYSSPNYYSSSLLPDINKPKTRTTTTIPTSITPILTTPTPIAPGATTNLNTRTRSPSVGAPIYHQPQTQYEQLARIQSPQHTNNLCLVKQFNDLTTESNANVYNTNSYNTANAAYSKPIYEQTNLNDNLNEDDLYQLFSNGSIGLKNLGNTCFMNSIFQCLNNSKLLILYILKKKYVNDLNTTLSRMKGLLFKTYAQLVISMWSTKNNVVSPQDFRSKIIYYAPRFGGYYQQDAQEFLRYLLLGLHEDVNLIVTKPKAIVCDEKLEERMSESEKSELSWNNNLLFDKSKIVDIFNGQLRSVLTCTHCNYKSVKFDSYWDLSLPLPTTSTTTTVTLFDCINLFMTEEILDGNEKAKCERCKQHRKSTKRFSIQRLPKNLVLHLKRFSPDQRRKLETNVQFPINNLDLKNYLSETAEKNLCTSYDLYGVSYHTGSLSSGHYTASCKHPFSKKWFHYNDSYVNEISENGLQSSQAYVLFYERTN